MNTRKNTDTQDWVGLISFLITAVIGSHLSARARRQAYEANQRRIEANRLYEFSQHLLNARNPLELLKEIPEHIVRLFSASAAALYLYENHAITCSGTDTQDFDEARLVAAQARGEYEIDRERAVCFCPVRLGPKVIGSFGVTGAALSKATLEAIAPLIASAIDRAQAIELLTKAEAARETGRLRSVLLDAIAHDFKTPLTSIKAAATSLLEDLRFNKRQRGELLVVIDEECDRINRVIGQAIEMAQLDVGEVKLQLATRSVGELLDAISDVQRNHNVAQPVRDDISRHELYRSPQQKRCSK